MGMFAVCNNGRIVQKTRLSCFVHLPDNVVVRTCPRAVADGQMLVGWLAGCVEDALQGVGVRKCDNASTQSVRETSGAQWPFPRLTSPLRRGRREPSRLSSQGLPASQPELDWPGHGRARQPKQFFFFSLTTGVPPTAAAAISNDRLFFCTPTRTHSRWNTAHILFLPSQPQLRSDCCPALRDSITVLFPLCL